ncbi:MAG TPA: LysM peptidoglycan-binding domain-containing protein [Flavobacteriales bacterium]|nr:LysM peptidoglycan-binding domain-containing protein [Flavobacteriales bacterium]HRE96978.1 LysM peptidoglycan-binding domain-containing protein [Flavobacteriales bacterium]HRJ35732.1 LysM peptidoglycan-binding domain-containing protein [Flavobacteriales bacterium]HRJ37926.1 LysM peptidoglycan-binding domain-containing protein [Flavobacteriales bacterium]
MIKRHLILFLYCIILCSVPLVSMAQPGDAKKETIEGKEYYIHTVAKGETVYGISKIYKVSQEQILQSNPEAAKGLDVGQKLKIPVASSAVKDKTGADATEKEYKALMAEGERFMSIQDYPGAEDAFIRALKVKPNDAIATSRIKEARDLAKAKKEVSPEPAKNIEEGFTSYTVEKKETLYGISKKTGVAQEKILELNPDAKDGLKEGQVLRLPSAKKQNEPVGTIKNETPKDIPLGNTVLIEHVVAKGESIYGLSRKYKVSEDSLKIYNNGLQEGLKLGQTLVVPVSKKYAEENNLRSYPDLRTMQADQKQNRERISNSTFEVALMLPFCLDKNQSLMESRSSSANSPVELFEPTRQSLDFYHGVMLAVDSLRQYGLNIHLHVFDTARDSAKLSKYVKEAEFAGLDLIIGPTEQVEMVAKAASEKKIAMICPFAYTNKILLGNATVSKAVTTASVMINAVADHIGKLYATENIFLIDTRSKKDQPLYNAFRSELNAKVLSNGAKDSVKMIRTEASSSKAWIDRLSKEKVNIFVIPSTDLSFVNSFFNTLQGVSLKTQYKDYQFMIFGLEEWLKYDEIEANLKVKFNLHLPSPVFPSFVDSARTIPFIKAFRSKFSTDPDRFAMMGFDVAYFYLGGFLHEGRDFSSHLDRYDVELVHTRFRFRKMGEDSGFLNDHSYILRYQDFQLKVVYP